MTNKKLSSEDQSEVEKHLSECAKCRETLAGLDPHSPTQIAQEQSREEELAEETLPDELQDHPRYRVKKVLGRGGMGTVYYAEHRLLDRPLVLKVIRPELVENTTAVQRFQREARLAAKMTHPNIVAVYEAEELGKTQLLVMEFIEGVDLADLVSQRGLLPVAESCELIRQAAIGLQHVHEQGLVHRDIKPANLLVSPTGIVKILDLGLATLKSAKKEDGELTAAHQFLGTVDFASPEQWESSRDVDIRSDIYSLGCTLYYLIVGQSPFPSSRYSTTMQQMWAHSQAPLPPIRELRPDVPEEIEAIIAKMLAKDVDERFASPIEVAKALEPFVADCDLAEFVSTARRTTTSRMDLSRITSKGFSKDKSASQAGNRIPRRSLVIGTSILAVGALIGLVYAAFFSGHSEPTETTVDNESLDKPGGVFAPPSGRPIRIGVLHSQTSTMAISEKPVIDAILLAIEELNTKGGVLGRPVEPVIEDGESDWNTFAVKAEKLITEDKVCSVFGCWTSASRKTVRPIFEKHNHLLFYPVQYEGLEESPNIVYTGAAPNQQIIPAVRWCFTSLNKKSFFLVGSDYVFPRCANAIIRDTVADLGGEIAGEEYLLLGASDASDIVQKIVDTKPDVILNTINGDSNIPFFRALRAAGVTSEAIPTISFSISEQELSNLNTRDIIGDYAAWNYFQSINRDSNIDFVKRFHARYGEARIISDPMESAYTAVNLWAQAVEQAGSDDVHAIREAVRHQEFEAPGCRVKVDPQTQHISKVFRIGQIAPDGRLQVKFSSESPISPIPYPNTRSKGEWDAFLLDLKLQWNGEWANPGN